MKTKGKNLYTKTITLPNGKRKYIRAANKADLDRKYNEIKAQVGAGIDVGNTTTVVQIAQIWYDVYKKPSLGPKAQQNLKYVMNNWIMPRIGGMKVSDVKPLHIREILAAQEGLSQSLQRKTRQALDGIFLAAKENHLIMESPVTDQIKASGKPPKEKTPLNTDQSKQLLMTMKGTRAYIVVALMLGAGLRKEEACGLMWSDIDFENGTLTVNRVVVFVGVKSIISEKGKSDAALRTIPLPHWLVEDLKAEKAASSSLYVVPKTDGGVITDSSFRRLWGMIEARTTDDPELIGKPVDNKHPDVKYGVTFHVHPHLLRHTCITKWIEAGLDVKAVQYLAGHATPEITLKIYAHYLETERQKETAKKIKGSEILAAVSI